MLVRKISSVGLLACALFAQPARITVDAARSLGPVNPIYRFFGYDEPNFTYTPHGRKLIAELAALSPEPVYLRTHFLLATGDGTPALKWGSTNAYTEDSSGRPIYDWTILDRIFDTYAQAHARPFVEIGFMPQALSIKPDPYQPVWSPGAAFDRYYVGWSYPPKDYAKWSELIRQWVLHAVARYGAAEVAGWYWEVWNEPDIGYWHGSPEEYDKLYDATAAAVKRALPAARVGGPAVTGPSNPRAAAFLRQFLDHCDRAGVPLDFVTFHAKGRTATNKAASAASILPPTPGPHPQPRERSEPRMNLAKQADDVDAGFRIVAGSPKFHALPIILSESDPEGCAACTAQTYPQNAYRNTPQYAAYTAAMMSKILDLAAADQTNIAGMLTWAFEFEGQPYFAGFRTLATNGIDKPILNFFRMAGQMRGERIASAASDPNIGVLASRSASGISVLVWNYDDEDRAADPAQVRLEIRGLPPSAKQVLVRHYRIDERHSNAFTAWKQMGTPQHPSPAEYAALEAAGQLQELESPRRLVPRSGQIELTFDLPRESVSLLTAR